MHRLVVVAAVCGALFTSSCGDDAVVFVDAATDADTADANAPLGMLPASLDLSLADCGTATTRTFSVVNSGNAALDYTLVFSDPAFTVTPTTGSIVAGASTTFTVTANVPQDATAGTALTATLSATTNLPGSPHTVPVTVTPRGAHFTITPPSVGFGQVEAGTTSAPQTAVVANTGNASASIAIVAPGGEFSGLFGTAGSITLSGGQSAVASFTYSPTGLGADTGSAAVAVTGLHCGAAPTSIPLSGEGAVSGGVLVQGTPVDFGTIACGATASTATVTLMNTTNLPAPFSASFLTDPEADQARYSVAPASGTVPANATTTLTVTRLAIALPATPRAYDATLRISTTVPAAIDTDVPVRQSLGGPFLTATPLATNFGYASPGNTRTGPLTVTNTGTAAATLQTTSAAPFALQLPAMIAAAGSADATMTYSPAALGSTTGSATITAAGACSAPVALTFTAGDGPELSLYTYGANVNCPVPAQLGGPIYVSNSGNQSATLTCAETTTTDLVPVFSPSPLTVGAGTGASLDVAVSPGNPIRAGSTTATFRCTSNEPLGNLHDLSYARALNGTDLVLAAPDPLDFTCFQTAEKLYTITSAATSTTPEFVMPNDSLVFPLGHDFTQLTLNPGENVTNSVTTYGGGSAWSAHGVGDPCASGANPGDPVFNGTVGINTGSGSICSVTPATLPVVLRAATPQ